MSTDAPLVAFGVDGPSRLVATDVVVPRGTSAVVPVSFTLPAGVDVVRVLPSARPWPSRWRTGGAFGGAEFVDSVETEIELGASTES